KVDERGQPAVPRLLFLRADDVPDGDAPVTGRLGLEVLPGLPVRAKAFLVLGRELPRRVLERILLRARLVAIPEGGQTRLLHQSELDQLLRPADVDVAPDAARPPRRKADRVALVIDPLADAVDPAEAERLVDGFFPGDARLPRIHFVEADEQFLLRAVVLAQPIAPGGGCGEEGRLRAHRFFSESVSSKFATGSSPSFFGTVATTRTFASCRSPLSIVRRISS